MITVINNVMHTHAVSPLALFLIVAAVLLQPPQLCQASANIPAASAGLQLDPAGQLQENVDVDHPNDSLPPRPLHLDDAWSAPAPAGTTTTAAGSCACEESCICRCSAVTVQVSPLSDRSTPVPPGLPIATSTTTLRELADGTERPCRRGAGTSVANTTAGTIKVGAEWTCESGASVRTTEVFSCHESGALSWTTRLGSDSVKLTELRVSASLGVDVAASAEASFWAAASVPLFTANGSEARGDPFAPFADTPDGSEVSLLYGGAMMDPFCPNNGSAVNHSVLGTPLPLGTLLLLDRTGLSLSLIGSLRDDTRYMSVNGGRRLDRERIGTSLSRYHVRHGNNSQDGVRFQQFVVSHAADWRPAVGWLQRLFPEWLDQTPSAHARVTEAVGSGGGAYANYRGGPINTTFLERAGFGFNVSSRTRLHRL